MLWDKGELDYLRENFSHTSHGELCTKLNRKWSAVEARAWRLGLKRHFAGWTEEEDNVLRELWSNGDRKLILSRLDRTQDAVQCRARKLSLSRRKGRITYRVDENFFDVDNSDTAYVLGWLYTDGYIQRAPNMHMGFNLGESEPLKKIRAVLKSNHPICRYKWSEYTRYVFDIHRTGMVSRLLRSYPFLLAPKKVLEYPRTECHRDFIRGFFDGDGSVSVSKHGYISVDIEGQRHILEQLSQVLYKRAELSGIKEVHKHGGVYVLRYAHYDSLKFADFLYNDLRNNLYLSRKRKRFVEGGWNP